MQYGSNSVTLFARRGLERVHIVKKKDRESDVPGGPLSGRTPGTAGEVMMVIDVGRIQTEQTPQQIKRPFCCEVVKEQNSMKGAMRRKDPSPPPFLL